MPRTIYLYRATMYKNGEEETLSTYLYAKNKKAAKRFCVSNFDHFDRFEAVKFGETSDFPSDKDASFLSEQEELALYQAHIAENGEVYAERRNRGDTPCRTYQEATQATS